MISEFATLPLEEELLELGLLEEDLEPIEDKLELLEDTLKLLESELELLLLDDELELVGTASPAPPQAVNADTIKPVITR